MYRFKLKGFRVLDTFVVFGFAGLGFEVEAEGFGRFVWIAERVSISFLNGNIGPCSAAVHV